MKLSGYDVFRFGGYEFLENEVDNKIVDFFEKILKLYFLNLQMLSMRTLYCMIVYFCII